MKISPVTKRFMNTVDEMRGQPSALMDQIAHMPTPLIQCTLPHSDPGNVDVWERENGGLILTMRRGWNRTERKFIGYPYGVIPRLLIFWLSAEVYRVQKRRIELSDTITGFMRELGLNPASTGKRGDAKRLQDQMERLFRAAISFEDRTSLNLLRGVSWVDTQIAPKGELWWSHKDPEQPSLVGSWIELSEDCYDLLLDSRAPLDMRALKALRKSPLQLDLYAWFSLRSFTAMKSGNYPLVSWEDLMRQMGCDYAQVWDFKRKVLQALPKIELVYPKLSVAVTDEGISFLKGTLPAIDPDHWDKTIRGG